MREHQHCPEVLPLQILADLWQELRERRWEELRSELQSLRREIEAPVVKKDELKYCATALTSTAGCAPNS